MTTDDGPRAASARGPGAGTQVAERGMRPAGRWLVNAVYAGVLVILAVLPSVPSLAADVADLPDWAAHGAAYGVQAALLYWAILPAAGLPRAVIWGVLGAVAFGGATEALQLLQPARSVELRDLVANAVGAAAAGGVAAGVTTLSRRGTA